jgi:large subunit ribosomal protein L40e
MPESFQIFVRNLQNTSIALTVSPGDSIQDIKEHIQAKEGIPIQIQRLVFQGKELRGLSSVQETQISRNDSLYLLLSLKGGGNSKSALKVECLEKQLDYNAHKSKPDPKFEIVIVQRILPA